MGKTELEAAIRLMESHPDMMHFVGPRPPELVNKAEEALGLRFPQSFRQFQLRFGAGNFGPAEIFGIINENFRNAGIPDGIWFTLDMRAEGVVPPQLVVFYFIDDGGYYFLDASQMNAEGECPVVEYYPGIPEDEQPKTLVASDFGTLLLQLVSQVLEWRAKDK